jgi:biofilm PGA synthesis N-glycosyltransferase PgaC
MNNMRNKTPTVTVGLAAYNEEVNIENIIRSILDQNQTNFILKQIVVVSDGSSDETVKIIRSIKNQKIKLIANKKRLGQPSRLNQIYSLFDSDFLIQTDADAVFAHKLVLENTIKGFRRSSKTMMIGGNISPIKPKSFLQKAIYSSNAVYKTAGEEFNDGNNIFTVHGPFMAFRKAFVKNIRLPKTIIASDKYMYLTCIIQGHRYKFIKNANVFFELPLTLKDQIKQNTRFKVAKRLLYQHFPVDILQIEYYLPKGLILKKLLIQLIKEPVSLIYIFLINRYCKILAYKKQKQMANILWDKLERTAVNVN